ncbi:MAG: cysteine hydrolase [SAR202 cluster bacterium]|nr:cysteine hydrolase [SAR202 cluster bacterium]
MIIRHPVPLLTKETKPLLLTKRNTCLVCVDMHNPFSDRNGLLAQRIKAKVLDREFDEYFHLLRLITPNIPRVLDACRSLGVSVAYSCLGYKKGEKPSEFQKATGWEWDLDGPLGGFPHAWRPLPDEPVFSKPAWSALANPKFERWLKDNKFNNVVLMGCYFDFGVRQTAMELNDRGVSSLVITDCSAGTTQFGHDYTFDSISQGLIKLRYTGELLGLFDVMKQQGKVLV